MGAYVVPESSELNGVHTFAGFLVCVFMFCSFSGLFSEPARALDRDEALKTYSAVMKDSKVSAGWTGSVDGCRIGTESQASLDATLRTVNGLRAIAGILPVTLNPEMNQNALAAALMMRAAGDLSHSPGTDWPCFSVQGAEGAATSNLYLGRSGPSAMVGYVDDSGVPSLGHRRWLLDPAAMEFGSGSTGGSNALTVVGSYGDGSREESITYDKRVAWPPEGSVPWPWVFGAWSVSVGTDQYEIEDPSVSVTSNGRPLEVGGVRYVSGGFGTGSTISWTVDIPGKMRTSDQEFDVQVEGSSDLAVHYTVKPFTVPGDGTANNPNGGPRKVFNSRLMLTKLKDSRVKRLFRLGYSSSVRGRSAKVVIRRVQMECDSTGYCFDGKSRLLRQTRIKLTGAPVVKVKKPTRRLTKTIVRVSVEGKRTSSGYVRGYSVERTLLGPGLHWN